MFMCKRVLRKTEHSCGLIALQELSSVLSLSVISNPSPHILSWPLVNHVLCSCVANTRLGNFSGHFHASSSLTTYSDKHGQPQTDMVCLRFFLVLFLLVLDNYRDKQFTVLHNPKVFAWPF